MWPPTGACSFAVKSYDQRFQGSILLREKSAEDWDGSTDRGWVMYRQTEKRFCFPNGEDPPDRCTWWYTANWMAPRQQHWGRARRRNFRPTERLRRRLSCPHRHN